MRAALTAGNRPYDEKGLPPRRDGVGQRGIRQFVRPILFACEEAHETPPLLRDVVADCPAQHWIAGLECVEDRTLSDLALDVERHFATDARQRPEVRRQYDPDHGSV